MRHLLSTNQRAFVCLDVHSNILFKGVGCDGEGLRARLKASPFGVGTDFPAQVRPLKRDSTAQNPEPSAPVCVMLQTLANKQREVINNVLPATALQMRRARNGSYAALKQPLLYLVHIFDTFEQLWMFLETAAQHCATLRVQARSASRQASGTARTGQHGQADRPAQTPA